MGKKKSDLGRTLIKDRFGGGKHKHLAGDKSMLHTCELQDGYEWGRLNLQSVTERSNLEDFLATAELARTEFQAEKLNITFVSPTLQQGVLSLEEKAEVEKLQQEHRHFLQIPRKPCWTETTTAEELQTAEREAFLEWRRQLAALQEVEGIILTPFEKNLEFWRQLWRVVERSDVIVQIVDARNPLLFRCEDLERYVKEMGEHKMNVILVNKADFLTDSQREIWAGYFASIGVRAMFFSAIQGIEVDASSDITTESEDEFVAENSVTGIDDGDGEYTHEEVSSEKYYEAINVPTEEDEKVLLQVEARGEKILGTDEQILEETAEHIEVQHKTLVTEFSADIEKDQSSETKCEFEGEKLLMSPDHCLASSHVENDAKLLTRGELVSLLKSVHKGKKENDSYTTVGFVGYPNVGKSSTINRLLTYKKVPVSTTPGRTKHFQTLFVDEDLCLCDCPGLVMPSFLSTTAEMIISGILPVDQMRDHVPAINTLSSLIPRHILEDTYGIILPMPSETEAPDRPPTSEELLNMYGYMRGFMTHRGLPDNPRAARYILKDYVNGKLLYCCAPPGCKQEEFHVFSLPRKAKNAPSLTPNQVKLAKPLKTTVETLDKDFFKKMTVSAHIKSRKPVIGHRVAADENIAGYVCSETSSSNQQLQGKPWKKHNKHNRREKLRRKYKHLDQ